MSAIDRRTFVVAGLATVVAGAALSGCRPRVAARLTLKPDGDGLAAVGRTYLAAHPEEAGLAQLVRSVPALAGATTRTEARRALGEVATAARRDFAEGRIVSVGTWRLAQSEARAAAVVALLPA